MAAVTDATMTDAIKRKEPEPTTPEKKDTEVKIDEQTPVAKVDQPDAKRAKVTVDPAVVRKQVEYYLSDENLRQDKFFSEKIAADAEGWLDVNLILSCNKMKVMRATQEHVVTALAESKIEMKDGGASIRRPGNAALPELVAKQSHNRKGTANAHIGGCVVVFKNVPAEQNWTTIKDTLKTTLPEKVGIWHVSEVNDKSQCFVVLPPFENDAKFCEALELEVGGAKLRAELVFNEVLQNVLKNLPRHVRDKRERESRKKQKERNRPIQIGTQRFVNVGALRGKVKEIINSRSDGEALKAEGTDFKLIMALLSFHPKGEEKTKDTTGLKVSRSPQGENRCFFLVKEGGVEEDVSMKKCIDAVEANPPFAAREDKKEEKKDAPKVEEKKAEEPAKIEEKKAEEPAKVEEKKVEEPKVEEKKAEVEETKA